MTLKIARTRMRRKRLEERQEDGLDEEEEAIRFPDTKSGAQTRVIGRAAIELLCDQPKTKSPYFFPADWGDGHFVGVVRVLDRVCEKARLKQVRQMQQRRRASDFFGSPAMSA